MKALRKGDLWRAELTGTAKRSPALVLRESGALLPEAGTGMAVDEFVEGADRCRFLPG